MPSPLVILLLQRQQAIAGKQANDLLGAIVAYLRAQTDILSILGTGFGEGGFGSGGFGAVKLSTDEASKDTLPPYLLIDGYDEELPGETLEDLPVQLTLSLVSASLDEARAFGQVVKNTIDSVAINPASTRTHRLTWVGGSEQGVMRNPSKPYKVKGIAKNGLGYLYREDIEYEFWISPTTS